MKLEDQVCTLEQAKRLKELGVDARSVFMWAGESENEAEPRYTSGYDWSDYPCYSGMPIQFPAYTVAELMSLLPPMVRHNGEDYFLYVIKGFNRHIVNYRTNRGEFAVNEQGELNMPVSHLFKTFRSDKSLAWALSEMAALLLEHDLMPKN